MHTVTRITITLYVPNEDAERVVDEMKETFDSSDVGMARGPITTEVIDVATLPDSLQDMINDI